MSESAVADFVGRYAPNPKSGIAGEPDSGRIVMSKRRLVIAGDDERITVPLASVVDVVVGNVPPDLRDLFDDTVTIGYETDGRVETVLIEGGEETMGKFINILFKCLLNGTEGVVKHPARVGGRVTDEPVKPTRLSIGDRRVRFETPDGGFEIDITSIVDFDRGERAPDGTERPTLAVKHADAGQVQMSLLSPSSTRELNLLGRYLRIEYSQLRNEVADIELSAPEKQVLVTIYATGGDIDFTTILDGDAAQATNVLNTLGEKGLIDEGDTLTLTSAGRIVVSERLEDVNM